MLNIVVMLSILFGTYLVLSALDRWSTGMSLNAGIRGRISLADDQRPTRVGVPLFHGLGRSGEPVVSRPDKGD